MTIPTPHNSKTPWRLRLPLFALILSLTYPSQAGAWGTEEHIAFGQQISQPFDDFIDGALPVKQTEDFENLVLNLGVSHLDEGLKVQVDGHLVAYLTRSEMTDLDDRHDSFITKKINIPLLTTSAVSGQADGSHVIRLVHMNSCDEERALEVTLSLENIGDADCARCDGLGTGFNAEADEVGCSTGGKSGSSAATLLLLALIGLRRRRFRIETSES